MLKLAYRSFFAAYMLRLTLFLLSLADLNDRQGLFSPAITNEPRHACIYAAKMASKGLFSPAITNEPRHACIYAAKT